MKIVYVTQIVPYPPHGGVLQRGFNLLRELARRHRIHLLAFHHPDELPEGEAVSQSRVELGKFCEKVEYFPLWAKKSNAHRAAALAFGALNSLPFSVLAHRSRALRQRLTEICASSDRPDVVHLDTIALAPYLKFCSHVPVVLAHQNVESQLMERRARLESSVIARAYVRLQARRLRKYEANQGPRFRLNIMVSDVDATRFKSFTPGIRTAVVSNGVDTEYFTARTDDEIPAAIYTGGMNMFANRDAVEWFLEEMWPRIRSAVPDARFFAVGQRPSPRVLAAARANIGVEAPGHVDDVRPWVARAAVYVVPLRVGGGTRLKMVDAMAQGKAIVATSLGAEGIHGDDGLHFVVSNDAEHFAREVIRLMRDPAGRRALGKAARARVEQEYGWPLLAGRLAGLYSEVIRGGGN